jgi:uncharacterized protein (DUF2225 family)
LIEKREKSLHEQIRNSISTTIDEHEKSLDEQIQKLNYSLSKEQLDFPGGKQLTSKAKAYFLEMLAYVSTSNRRTIH